MSDGNTGIRLLAAIIGFWVLMRALNKDASGRTLVHHLLGQSGGANMALNPPGSAANPIGTPNAKGQVNPVPGSTASRLDQGIDVTGKTFVSPYAGTVVASEVSDSGWGGGGYVAVANAANPNQVTYFAEGLTPLVTKGQTVKAGQGIGRAVLSPYPTGGVGSIEIGPANPKNPLQPLAQVVKDPAAVVRSFAAWLASLGGPTPTSTANAGRA